MTIGFRTIKTAVGVSIAILIAQSLHLSSYTSAGILALLCIQKNKKTVVHSRLGTAPRLPRRNGDVRLHVSLFSGVIR